MNHRESAALAGSINGAEMSADLWPVLLAPAAWQPALEKYARAMHLAVALTDVAGRQLGKCLNPQPLWRLLRDTHPVDDGGCPFHLLPRQACTCVADALVNRSVAQVRDYTGLAHFAVPLELDGQVVGALVAGQVFDQYPQQLVLEKAAKKLGLSIAKVWQTARLEFLVSQHALRVYADLLATYGNAFLHNRYHTLREAQHVAELQRAHELLHRANEELEKRVEERTAELQAAQSKALQTERLAAIGQTVAGLAHEGRNALQRSHGCLERLGWKLQGRADELDLIARAQNAQDDLIRLFEDVQGYAAPVRLNRTLCDMAEVWRDVWDQLAPQRAEREVHLDEEVRAGHDLHCYADPFRLGQVFRNILENALTACTDPVRIEITGREEDLEDDPGLRVAVRDNGPGLNDEQRRCIFEPFYTTKHKGTGLGMAIAKRIVEAHGGRIAVGDTAGPGAEIVITLPRSRP
jgi:signal transduction histidine kinase